MSDFDDSARRRPIGPIMTVPIDSGAPLRVWAGFVAIVAIAAIFLSVWNITRASDGLSETVTRVGSIPVTVFRSVDGRPSPVVVVAHGFAGSQQLMRPMAMTLARNGYIAVTFDFAGHGRNPEPLEGGIADMRTSTNALLGEIKTIVAFALTLSGSNRRLALVGHSMASDLVVEYSMEDPKVEATVALSLFGRNVTATNPKNLIVIDGAWETSMLTDAGLRIVGVAAGALARERVTYGDVSRGDGRRFVLASGAEHIGVLYSRDALRETVAWLNETFGRSGAGFIDGRGKWLALLFLGLVGLGFPTSRLLPVVSPTPLGAAFGWRRLVPVAVAPALITPLVLWKLPANFLPILLGDYLVMHFLLYGLLTLGGLLLSGGLRREGAAPPSSRAGLAISAVALAGYYVLAIGMPIDAYVTSFVPTGIRWPLVPAMFCGTAIYFLADEWLTRGAGAAWGGYAFTKLCFLASLVVAVALNPQRLFFLVIIVPVIFVLFLIYGLLSRWVYSRTRDPRVGALGNAFGLAWAIAVTFPVVG